MIRTFSLALLTVAVFLAGSPPTFAQFPNIFEQLFRIEPPRPPSDIPGGRPQQQIPPGGLPPGPPPGRIQQRPLPPPPGAAQRQQQQQQQQQPGTAAVPGLPPGIRQPPGTPQPANTAPQPGDEIIMEPPAQKIANPTAVFSGLDKITGRIINFEVAIDETVRFGALEVTPRVCYTRPPTMSANTDGFIEVDELTLQGELRRIFTGWMFAASPGLNAVEHPIYDIWLTDCKGGAPPAVAEAQPEPQPAAQQQPQPRPQRTQQPRRVQPAQQLPPPLPPPGTSPR